MSNIIWGDLSPKERSLFRAATNEMARAFLAGLYAEGLADPEAVRHFAVLSRKLDKIKAGENPFLIYHAWSRPLRQLDFLNWRQAGGHTVRSANRRANRVARGDIADTEYRARSEAEEDIASFDRKVELRDMIFPGSFASDEAVNVFCESRDVRIDIEHVGELRLEANPQGSWALYALQPDGSYKRTLMVREYGFRVLPGEKVKEVRYG